MKYSFHPNAERDLREAAEFYRQHGGNPLAQALFLEFERSMATLLEDPSVGPIWRNGKRRDIMKHFPYSLIYTPDVEEIRILAVAHHRRHPGYWQARK